MHLSERLGQAETGRVEIGVAVERRSVMLLERLGVVDFHPAVIFREPEERPSVCRGVTDPAADDLLGLAQPVGHQVKPGERLVDRRIRLDLGLIKPHQDRLGLGESANSRERDRVQPLELAFGIPERAGLVQLIGDFSEITFLERDLGEKGMPFGRAGFGSKPTLERLFRLAVTACSDSQPGFASCASGCEGAPDLECEEQREHDPRDRGRDPYDGAPARPISRNHRVTG